MIGNILALSTSGLSVTKCDGAVVLKGNEGVDAEGNNSSKGSSSSDQSASQTTKSHKKAHSLGYLKLPGFKSTKEHIGLQQIDGTSFSESLRAVSSEINVPSEKPDGAEVLATSPSESNIFDYRL